MKCRAKAMFIHPQGAYRVRAGSEDIDWPDDKPLPAYLEPMGEEGAAKEEKSPEVAGKRTRKVNTVHDVTKDDVI